MKLAYWTSLYAIIYVTLSGPSHVRTCQRTPSPICSTETLASARMYLNNWYIPRNSKNDHEERNGDALVARVVYAAGPVERQDVAEQVRIAVEEVLAAVRVEKELLLVAAEQRVREPVDGVAPRLEALPRHLLVRHLHATTSDVKPDRTTETDSEILVSRLVETEPVAFRSESRPNF